MSIVVELPVHPFAVPETVTVDLPPGPSGEARSEPVPLSALTADALSQLCDEFRRAAFEKAQMGDPDA